MALLVHILHGIAAQADVGGLIVLQERLKQLAGLMAVAGEVHPHAGDGAHGGDVLGGVVGHAQRAVAHAAGDAHKLHIGAGIGAVHLALLIAARGQERRGGRREGLLAAGGQPGGDAHQVLLGNAHLHKLLGKLLREGGQRGRAPAVAAQHHHVPVPGGGFLQHLAHDGAVGDLIHAKAPPSSGTARP